MNIKDFNGNFTIRTNLVAEYLREINKYPVLTPSEEEELILKIKSGDEKAREQLINCNQRFVFAIAKRYANDDMVMDLVNEGNIGLITAIEKYDNTRGIRFLSFAVWYIRRSINYYLTNTNLMVKRTNNMKIGSRVNKIKNTYFCKNGRYPTEDEIIEMIKEKFNIDIQVQSEVFDISTESINSYFDDDESNTVEKNDEFNSKTASYNEYMEKIEQEYNNEIISSLLSTLNERDREIIKMSFGIGYSKEYTNDDIANELGICAERIRQIKNHVLEKFKKIMMSKQFSNIMA